MKKKKAKKVSPPVSKPEEKPKIIIIEEDVRQVPDEFETGQRCPACGAACEIRYCCPYCGTW